jgi:ABC-type branched-subunit amino acid transport system permease subunit
VRANRVIAGAFAFAGLLAGVAAVLILMRSPSAEPTLGSDWLIKAVVAAIIGGLGSFSGAVVGGLVLGVAEVHLRSYLPATMITLAVLFVVDQAVKNWQELTRGAGGLSGVPRAVTNTWLWIAALVTLVGVNLFRETRIGRFAVATREDEIAAPAIGIDRFWPRWTAWVVSIAAGALRVQAIGSTNCSSTRSTSACCCWRCWSSAACAPSPGRSPAPC